MLDHEQPLSGYSRRIGGSAGQGTFGGSIERPKEMPTREEADHVVSTKDELLDAVTEDDAIVYIDDDIDVSGARDIRFGDGITLVGGYCDPSTEGRGPVIRQQHYERRLFISKWGEAPTFWGVSLRGPNTSYFDPRDRANSDEWNSDKASDWYATGLHCYDEDELEVHGCEFWGWTLAGLEIGSRGHMTPATIKRTSFHHNIMETLGYGIEHYNGDIWIDRCFFDSCRHGFSGFGYPGEFVDITNCVIGPGDSTEGWCGHALDMHKLEDNLHNGNWTAGGHYRIRNCTSMCTWDLNGYDQEGFAIRGTPEEQSWEDKNHWFQSEPPDAPGKQGDAYRQEVQDRSEGWQNFESRDSHFGESVKDGYGAPRASDERAGRDDEDEQTDDPNKQPSESMKLMIKGRGVPANYRITIKGDASTGDRANKGDRVRDNDDGTVTIVGYVNQYQDNYDLGKNAQLQALRASGPVDVYKAGKQVDLAPLVAAGAWQRPGSGDGSDAVSQLRKRVEELTKKLNSARVVFGGGES